MSLKNDPPQNQAEIGEALVAALGFEPTDSKKLGRSSKTSNGQESSKDATESEVSADGANVGADSSKSESNKSTDAGSDAEDSNGSTGTASRSSSKSRTRQKSKRSTAGAYSSKKRSLKSKSSNSTDTKDAGNKSGSDTSSNKTSSNGNSTNGTSTKSEAGAATNGNNDAGSGDVTAKVDLANTSPIDGMRTERISTLPPPPTEDSIRTPGLGDTPSSDSKSATDKTGKDTTKDVKAKDTAKDAKAKDAAKDAEAKNGANGKTAEKVEDKATDKASTAASDTTSKISNVGTDTDSTRRVPARDSEASKADTAKSTFFTSEDTKADSSDAGAGKPLVSKAKEATPTTPVTTPAAETEVLPVTPAAAPAPVEPNIEAPTAPPTAPASVAPVAPVAPVEQPAPVVNDPVAAPAQSRSVSKPTVAKPSFFGGRRKVQARKVRRVVRHVDPWSVLIFSVLFHLCIAAALLIASVLVWNAAEAAGTIEKMEDFIRQLGDYETFVIDGETIFRAAVGIAGVMTLASSVLLVLLTVMFNLISDLVGGIRVTVIEEETIRVKRK